MSDDAGDPAVDIKDLATYQHSETEYEGDWHYLVNL